MNEQRIDVSAIIPTYNRASLVERCIKSLHASGTPNLEVIVVDDGGKDNTADVARALGAVFLTQKNAGPAEARNNGFRHNGCRHSHGRYVVFIDSDDEWTVGGIPRLVRQMDANPDLAVLFADSLMGSHEDGWVSFVGTYGGAAFEALPCERRKDGVRVLTRTPFFRALSTRNVMFLASTLVRREFFASVGEFDPKLRGAADWDFFMRVATAGSIGFSEGEAASLYYKHGEGMSTDSDHMEEEFARALDSVRRRAPLDPEERRHVEARLRRQLFGWAWLAYDRGDFKTARARLDLAREMGQFGPREMLYYAVTFAPPGLIRMLRRS
jgi:glycosyltransferase involved in cell wall biosynthesis